jgi:hypothetical protein
MRFKPDFIAHRINTVEQLKRLPTQYGVEVDLRDHNGRLIMQHDPFEDGEDFEEYLGHYTHGMMILNIKSERIEPKIRDLLKGYNVTKYFFLDCSFPMVHQLVSAGEDNIAVRFSEYERLDTVLTLQGKVKWVWVDCFTILPIDKDSFSFLKAAGFSLCLVSPELQGRAGEIPTYKKYLSEKHIVFDAICTDLRNIEKWL